MYNPDAENRYRQEFQPRQPASEQYWQPYAAYQPDQLAGAGEKISSQPPLNKGSKVVRTTKAEALAIVRTCKKWIIIGAIVSFGVFSGLAAAHVTGVTSQAATNTSTQQATPANSDPGNGGFFQQQPQQQGGYNFGNNSPSQGPVSGSRVS